MMAIVFYRLATFAEAERTRNSGETEERNGEWANEGARDTAESKHMPVARGGNGALGVV